MEETCVNCNSCCTPACDGEIFCVSSCGCCCTVDIRVAPGLTLGAGTIIAQRTADGFFVPFSPVASDGSQDPRGVLRYDTQTDADGAIISNFPMLSALCPPLYTSMFKCGEFRTEETIGDLASALAEPGFGRLVIGGPVGPGTWKLF